MRSITTRAKSAHLKLGIETTFVGFHEKLFSLPNPLTKSEIRLCTFIKLNFSTKEISNITKQSVNSINVAKYRLKSKLELDKNQTIESYFVNL